MPQEIVHYSEVFGVVERKLQVVLAHFEKFVANAAAVVGVVEDKMVAAVCMEVDDVAVDHERIRLLHYYCPCLYSIVDLHFVLHDLGCFHVHLKSLPGYHIAYCQTNPA